MSVNASSAPTTVIHEKGANQKNRGASNPRTPDHVGTEIARYVRHSAIGASRTSSAGRPRPTNASTTMNAVQTAPIQKP
jgi:hypothetical protein